LSNSCSFHPTPTESVSNITLHVPSRKMKNMVFKTCE